MGVRAFKSNLSFLRYSRVLVIPVIGSTSCFCHIQRSPLLPYLLTARGCALADSTPHCKMARELHLSNTSCTTVTPHSPGDQGDIEAEFASEWAWDQYCVSTSDSRRSRSKRTVARVAIVWRQNKEERDAFNINIDKVNFSFNNKKKKRFKNLPEKNWRYTCQEVLYYTVGI